MKTLGLDLCRKYSQEGILDIWGDFTNERKAHCKCCGRELKKGESIGAYFWAMQVSSRHFPKCRLRLNIMASCICGFRNQHVFICEDCDKSISVYGSKVI